MTKGQYDFHYRQCLLIIQFFRRKESDWLVGSFKSDLQNALRYENTRFVLILLQRHKNNNKLLEQISYNDDGEVSKTRFQVGHMEYLPFSVDELKFFDLNGIIINEEMSIELNQRVEDWIYDE